MLFDKNKLRKGTSVSPEQMSVLAQFSSGLDSLAAVCIAANKLPIGSAIDLFHIQLRVGSEHTLRWLVQLQSAIHLFRQLRVEYPQHTFNLMTPAIHTHKCHTANDIIYYQYLSAVQGRHYDFMINGTTKDDCINRGVNFPEFGINYDWSNPKKFIHHWQHGEEVFAGLKQRAPQSDMEIWRPAVDYGCDAILEIIPDSLKGLTWYCENPVRNGNLVSACGGVCHKCHDMENGKRLNTIDITEIAPIEDNFREYLFALSNLTG